MHKPQTTSGFSANQLQEIRLDIDLSVLPNVTGTMTDMSAVVSGSVDAIFSSNFIEHIASWRHCISYSDKA